MKYTNGRYGAIPRKDWGGALTGASSGFQMGSGLGTMFGPVGTAIGGAVGAIGGAIFGNRSENKKAREQKRLAAEMKAASDKAKLEQDLLYKKGVRANDTAQLASMDMNNANSLFMGRGGKVNATGMRMSGGNKLLTKNGSTSGTHESGANIPIKKNGETIAVAEPGEVLVNDKDISSTPFILSKKLGFAQKFMELERMKNASNGKEIEDAQSNIVNMNNKMAPKDRKAKWGLDLMVKPNTSNLSLFKGNTGIQKYSGSIGGKKRAGNIFGDVSNFLGENKGTMDIASTVSNVAGTVGNLLMSNKTLKYQKGLIKNSLDEALAYKPNLNKNYLLNENVDVNDSISAVNQGYASGVSGLEGLDGATASALRNSANVNRIKQLSGVFGERNRMTIGLRNQNTAGIVSNNASNNSLLNQTSLMKLNAKISANEQLGDASAAGLANNQAAISEFNTILRDKQMMKSLDARWKDSIGTSYKGVDSYKCGGKLRKKSKMHR